MSVLKSFIEKFGSVSFTRFFTTTSLNEEGVKLDSVQAQYLSERCIAVNEKDEPIRSVSKEECHRNPILHRAFSVFLFNSNRQLLLQRRSSTKITFPNVWTNTCCSHPLFNDVEMEAEMFLGIRKAAIRKLEHELGVTSLRLDRLHVMGRFLYKAPSGKDWVEHELDYALVVNDFDSDSLFLNPEEVSDVRASIPWLDIKKQKMHSIWTRANTIFAFTLTVLSAATLLAFITSLYFANTTPVTIKTANARIKSMPDYSVDEGRSDMAMMSLSVQADLSPIFNWNVKELFVYLVAEYSTMKNVVNQVVLWDKIVMRTDRQVVMEESINPKYYFLDDGSNLLGHQNVTLILKWNVVPNAGYLSMAEGQGFHVVQFPSNYVSGKF